MIILGIDPSINNIGFGMVDVTDRDKPRLTACGTMKTHGESDAEKLIDLWSHLKNFLNDNWVNPKNFDKVIIERPSNYVRVSRFNKKPMNVSAVIKLSMALGVIESLLQGCQIPIIEVPSTNRLAKKDNAKRIVKSMFNKDCDDHEADAIILALSYRE